MGRALAAGAGAIGIRDLTLVAPALCGPDALDHAVNTLARLVPSEKHRVISACVAVASSDGVIEVTEAEMVRAIACALDCPMPVLLPGQSLAHSAS